MKKLTIIAVAITLVLFGGIFIYVYKIHHTDAYRFKKEYEKLNGTKRQKDGKIIRNIQIDINNPMKYATADDIVEMMDKRKSFLVYFGFSDCPWCRSVVNNIIEVAKEHNIDLLYYVDVSEIRDIKVLKGEHPITTKEGTRGYNDLIDRMNHILDDYILMSSDGTEISTGEKRIYAPSIVAVVNGVSKEKTDGISSHQTDPYMKLTKKMNEDSIKKIECIIKCIEESNVCTEKTRC